MYNSRVGLCFLITSNVINTASDTSMAVITVALPTTAAISVIVASETGEVNSRNDYNTLAFGMNECIETVKTQHFSPVLLGVNVVFIRVVVDVIFAAFI